MQTIINDYRSYEDGQRLLVLPQNLKANINEFIYKRNIKHSIVSYNLFEDYAEIIYFKLFRTERGRLRTKFFKCFHWYSA